MWYKVDFRRLGVLLLPTFLRSPSMMAMTNVLMSCLEQINDDFIADRKSNIETATHNSQVCYLRKILNDKFDYDRRILIEDPNDKEETYVYTDGENKPHYLEELILYPESEFSDKKVDFVIKVPIQLESYLENIKNTVDYYRLASKRFKIEFYEAI
ncbi:hypothetical protein [Elizabethkingia meningoseptica]|uniref:hypothetical protein n=1 Tax=Elizabethkingia meningoseptica TaxID=238 RepID=UPI0023B093C1|nr:hypothetical protein [Elizabethkingia meningoseptica]MDE5525705.1 hypothetical protein [Elizabethkingia meningoseptica]